MAFVSTTEWDVRTTGSDSNGGGFDKASSGTDFSIQDSPQITYNDLVIDAATNTKITSAAHPFDSTHVGNIINITSGTGFTVQRVQVISVTSSVATCDKAVGTTSSTGGNGKLGGGLLTIGQAFTLLAGVAVDSTTYKGTIVWVKSGTYTLTSTVTLASSPHAAVVGYNSSHGDYGTKPLITTATNSTILFTSSNSGVNGGMTFSNLSFSNTAATRAAAVAANDARASLQVINCTFDGFSSAFTTPGPYWSYLSLIRVEIKNCTGVGMAVHLNRADLDWGHVWIRDCYVHDNGSHGIQLEADGGNQGDVSIERTIIASNSGDAVRLSGALTLLYIDSCSIRANTGGGVNTNSNLNAPNSTNVANFMLRNTAFWGNTGQDVTLNNGPTIMANFNNAYASGKLTGLSAAPGDVTLTADPFTSSTNFAPNSTAGGGALLKGAGYPGVFPGGSSTSYLDIGAVQGFGSPATFPPASSVYSGVDRGDGVTGTLHASNIATAAGSGSNLSAGILETGFTVDDVTGSLSPGGSVAVNPMGGLVR